MATSPNKFNLKQSFRENKFLYIGAAIALVILAVVLLG